MNFLYKGKGYTTDIEKQRGDTVILKICNLTQDNVLYGHNVLNN